jgi:hypothetical protein
MACGRILDCQLRGRLLVDLQDCDDHRLMRALHVRKD